MPEKPDTKRESSHTENLYTCTKKIISFQTQLKKVLPHNLVSPKQTNQNKIANRPKFLQDVFLYCHLNSINPNYSKNGPAVSPQCTQGKNSRTVPPKDTRLSPRHLQRLHLRLHQWHHQKLPPNGAREVLKSTAAAEVRFFQFKTSKNILQYLGS
jgi:hypothetical protein